MKKLLGMSMLAVALAGVPTQPAAAGGINFHFGIHMGFSWEHHGRHRTCGHGCFGHGGQSMYIVTFPGFEHHPLHHRPFPPPPAPDRPLPKGERKQEAAGAQWGYPALNYSYYHPVSYYAPSAQPSYYPAEYYYPQPSYYAPSYAPNYYQSPGITFDR